MATRASSVDLGSRAVLNSVLVLAARMVSRLVALFVVLALNRHLGPDQTGRYATLIVYSALVSVLADLGLSTLYTREGAREPGRLASYLSTVAVGKLGMGALTFGVLAVCLYRIGLPDLVLPGGVLLITMGYSNLLRNTFYARGRLGFEAVAILVETLIQSTLIVYGMRTGAHLTYFLWAYTATYGFTILYVLVVTRLYGLVRLRPEFDRRLFVSWLRLGLPLAVGYFLTNLYFLADVPILQQVRTFEEVGWYKNAYKLFEALQFVPMAIQSVVYPALAVYFRTSRERLAAGYRQLYKVLLLLGWPLTIGTCLLAHPIGVRFGLFAQSEPALRILALGIVFLFVNSAFIAMLYAIDRQDLFAWVTALAVVVNLALNLVLIPAHGYLAASATTVVTEAVFAVAAACLVGRHHRLHWVRTSWRVVVSGAVMGAAVMPLVQRSIFLSAPVGALVYVVALWLLRAVSREELDLFIARLRRPSG